MNGQEFQMMVGNYVGLIQEAGERFAAATEARMVEARPLVLAIDEDNVPTTDPAYRMDLALLRAAPVAVVPRHGEFIPLQENGHRFLLAAGGLFLEVRRPWLYFVHPLAAGLPVRMPFGAVEPKIELAFGRLGNAMTLIRQFARSALREAPNEWADMIVWNANTGDLSDLNVDIEECTPASVRYRCRDLHDHESIAIDLHSHGHLPAFFSDTDDADDAGSVKIAGVIGDLDKPDSPHRAAFRLCALGLYLPVHVPADVIFQEIKP